MPKEPKRKMSVKTGQSTRHAPLGQVIQDDANRDRYASLKKLPRATNREDDDVETEELLDVKTSKRILELSRDQMREVEEEKVKSLQKPQNKRVVNDSDNSSDEESEDEEEDIDDDLVQHDSGYVSMSNTGLTPEEESLLSNMMGAAEDHEPQRKTLADIIMEKIEEKETMADMEEHGDGDDGGVQLPVKVIQVSYSIIEFVNFVSYVSLNISV